MRCITITLLDSLHTNVRTSTDKIEINKIWRVATRTAQSATCCIINTVAVAVHVRMLAYKID